MDHWRALIENADARKTLEASLTAILNPAVLAHLPRALQLQSELGAVSAWIQARDAESDVLAIQSKADECLVGLVVLAENPSSKDQSIVHVGYLIAEQFWGQGAATETLKGLVSVMRQAAPIRLVGGVDVNNPASERVL